MQGCLCVMENFNRVFSLKMRNLDYNQQPLSSQGRMVDLGFSADSGYNTPDSKQIVLGLVQRKTGMGRGAV